MDKMTAHRKADAEDILLRLMCEEEVGSDAVVANPPKGYTEEDIRRAGNLLLKAGLVESDFGYLVPTQRTLRVFRLGQGAARTPVECGQAGIPAKPKEISMIEWKCPQCGAETGKCGRTAEGDPLCTGCEGLICECWELSDEQNAVSDREDHGSMNNPCLCAQCAHCGWSGEIPPKPKKLTGWQKKAWEAGWRPIGA